MAGSSGWKSHWKVSHLLICDRNNDHTISYHWKLGKRKFQLQVQDWHTCRILPILINNTPHPKGLHYQHRSLSASQSITKCDVHKSMCLLSQWGYFPVPEGQQINLLKEHGQRWKWVLHLLECFIGLSCNTDAKQVKRSTICYIFPPVELEQSLNMRICEHHLYRQQIQ